MSQMMDVAKTKAEQLAATVTADARWDLNDELLCQVFGFTLYGYVFGVGRLICFLDVTDINQIVESQLTRLGLGPSYASGLIDAAQKCFSEPTQSVQSQLAGIGHSYFGSEDLSGLVDAIFSNTQKLRAAQS